MSSVSAKDDFIELLLDTGQDPPEVVARVSRGRGRRMVTSERPVRERTAVADLKEEDVVTLLVQEITPSCPRSPDRSAGWRWASPSRPTSSFRIRSVCCPSDGGGAHPAGRCREFDRHTKHLDGARGRMLECLDHAPRVEMGSDSTSPMSRTDPQGTPAARSALTQSARFRERSRSVRMGRSVV